MTLRKRSCKKFVMEEMGGFPYFFIWAFLEWILIASLYIDGFLAFISTRFAKIFELEPPCVLCTRVDHILVGKDPNAYYNDSICECHKKDISSLAFCHVHRKLSDIQNMCEGCLFSFATEQESDMNTNKSLSSSLQKGNNGFAENDKEMVMKTIKTVNDYNSSNDGMLDVTKCSCCGEPLKPKVASKTYARSFSNVRVSTVATTSSPRALTCLTPTWKHDDSRYTELKFICDSELDMIEYDFGLTDAKQVKEDMKSGTVTLLQDSEENEEFCRTPNLLKSNKFFGIPLTDTTAGSPQWANKTLKKTSSEKSDILSETNDEASGDGDSILQQLKNQARTDKKTLQLLSMELEEERSASAVAANNAMAMITRLQAEKAAVQMDALQYQRMMEEQAEYDQEAIQILEDLLAKRDQHVKVMEIELEGYREKYGVVRKVGSEECEADPDECYQEWKSQSSSSFGEKSELESPLEKDYEDPLTPFGKDLDEPRSSLGMDPDEYDEVEDETDTYEEPLLDFETDKYELYGMLKNLENHIESSIEDEWDDADDGIDKDTDTKKATLKREVSVIRERLRALEADSGFLKHTAMTLQKGEKGAELLTEIAQHLRKLRHSETPDDTEDTEDTNITEDINSSDS